MPDDQIDIEALRTQILDAADSQAAAEPPTPVQIEELRTLYEEAYQPKDVGQPANYAEAQAMIERLRQLPTRQQVQAYRHLLDKRRVTKDELPGTRATMQSAIDALTRQMAKEAEALKQTAERQPSARYLCTNCRSRFDAPRHFPVGDFVTELALWILFIVPGIIYSIGRLLSRRDCCPVCRCPWYADLTTDAGKRLLVSLSRD